MQVCMYGGRVTPKPHQVYPRVVHQGGSPSDEEGGGLPNPMVVHFLDADGAVTPRTNIYLSIYLSVYLPISIYLSIYLSICIYS